MMITKNGKSPLASFLLGYCYGVELGCPCWWVGPIARLDYCPSAWTCGGVETKKIFVKGIPIMRIDPSVVELGSQFAVGTTGWHKVKFWFSSFACAALPVGMAAVQWNRMGPGLGCMLLFRIQESSKRPSLTAFWKIYYRKGAGVTIGIIGEWVTLSRWASPGILWGGSELRWTWAQSNKEIIIKSVFKCKFVIQEWGSSSGGGRRWYAVISFLIYAIVWVSVGTRIIILSNGRNSGWSATAIKLRRKSISYGHWRMPLMRCRRIIDFELSRLDNFKELFLLWVMCIVEFPGLLRHSRTGMFNVAEQQLQTTKQEWVIHGK